MYSFEKTNALKYVQFNGKLQQWALHLLMRFIKTINQIYINRELNYYRWANSELSVCRWKYYYYNIDWWIMYTVTEVAINFLNFSIKWIEEKLQEETIHPLHTKQVRVTSLNLKHQHHNSTLAANIECFYCKFIFTKLFEFCDMRKKRALVFGSHASQPSDYQLVEFWYCFTFFVFILAIVWAIKHAHNL